MICWNINWSSRNWSELQLILKKLIRTWADHLNQPHHVPAMCLRLLQTAHCHSLHPFPFRSLSRNNLRQRENDQHYYMSPFAREFTSRESINVVFSHQFCLPSPFLSSLINFLSLILSSLISFVFPIREFWVHTVLPLLDLHKFGKSHSSQMQPLKTIQPVPSLFQLHAGRIWRSSCCRCFPLTPNPIIIDFQVIDFPPQTLKIYNHCWYSRWDSWGAPTPTPPQTLYNSNQVG